MFHFELSGECHKYIFACEKYYWILTSELQISSIHAKALVESTIKMNLGTKQCLDLQICYCSRNRDQSLIFYLIFRKHSKINCWEWNTKIIFFVTHVILYSVPSLHVGEMPSPEKDLQFSNPVNTQLIW